LEGQRAKEAKREKEKGKKKKKRKNPTSGIDGVVNQHPRAPTLPLEGKVPLRPRWGALREQNDDTSEETKDAQGAQEPEENSVDAARVHQSRKEVNDGKLRDAKGHDARTETDDGPENRA